MISMTGYGYAEISDDSRQISVEIRSYNNRYLEINTGTPPHLFSLEPQIRSIVASKVNRGKIDVQMRVREYKNAFDIRVDAGTAHAVVEALNEIAAYPEVAGGISVGDVVRTEGVLISERLRDVHDYEEQTLRLVETALEELNSVRDREGEKTRVDIFQNLARIRSFEVVFGQTGAETERKIYDTVKEKFQRVLGDEAEENRIYAEAASLMIKHDVNEELVRLRSHLELFMETAGADGPVGKKLDFICQEINREINTMASKTLFAEVQRAVVEAKNALESIREQVRNVE